MTAKTTTGAELSQWLQAGEAFIIDVREPAEFAGGHIPGSVNLPLARLAQADLGLAAGRRLVLVCATGRRSGMGCAALAGTAGDNLYTLDGGLSGWSAAGGALDRPGRSVMPLERQVMLGAGLLVLAGVVLGTLVHPGFYGLSGFVGLGLSFAGLTGYCGMALLLARAPWNQAPAAPRPA